ncbi:GntR family transcriptional regulator [Paenibacillus albidus]|uniref:GntR family transcriptional regulator n=2 Tax=Paenibacillus albidus TaxID=2041023 RepID=A0A917CAN3_9BACL|nr:GntR family transcriptional regulator [Paenibacillus albidus]GGF81078.1 GntR family transcriptional regulator [Paenibacillus albidus]
MVFKKEIMNQLKEEILSLRLTPGTIISETALSERYQLSRTPIRDILKQLSLEDYIHIYPKKGNIVSYIDLESVEQIIYLRYALEKEIMKELMRGIPLKDLHVLKDNLLRQLQCIDEPENTDAFLELDDEFHKTMFILAGREFLWELIQQFNVHYVRYRKLHMLKKDKLKEIQQEHQFILDCIVGGEEGRIDELLHHHLRSDIRFIDFQEPYTQYIKQ